MRSRVLIVCALVVFVAGCSSEAAAPDTTPAATADIAAADSAATENEGNDFCALFAARVSQGLVAIRDAQAGGAPAAEDIATSLAAQAEVSQADLEAAAPPEPRALLQAMSDADAAGAAGDLSKMDEVLTDTVALNEWAIAHCGDDYAPVFEEYRGVIG